MAPPTPNPMNPSGPPIRRRQCAWGPTAYVFAGQVSRLMGPVAAALRETRLNYPTAWVPPESSEKTTENVCRIRRSRSSRLAC